MATKETKIQYRAICPVCFKQHAVGGTRMVDHGYTVHHDWHARQGSCYGVRKPHFGTPEGRAVTEDVVADLHKYVAKRRVDLARAVGGKIKAIQGRNTDRVHNAPLVTLTKVDGQWFTQAVQRFIYQCESNIKGATGDIEMMGKLIAEWVPVAPVAVEVECGPTLHMFWERSQSKVLCVYRATNMRGGYTHRSSTKVEAEVTCAACLKELARIAADKVVDEKAVTLVEEMRAKFGPWTNSYSDGARNAIREIRYKMPTVDKAVRQAACYKIER